MRSAREPPPTPGVPPPLDHVLVVRAGPGANCSSIGSAVEMLFLSASVGAAVLAAVAAALPPAPDGEAPSPPTPSGSEPEGSPPEEPPE